MKPCPSVETALAQLKGQEPQLRVKFDQDTSISSAGVKLSSKPTAKKPTLAIATSLVNAQAGDNGNKYLTLCLDLDAPFTSFSFMAPIAHWLQTDLVAGKPSDEQGYTLFETSVEPIMPYAGPGPPPPSAPHRYVFLVWKQSEGKDAVSIRKALGLGETTGLWSRIRWEQGRFEEALGLGAPLAVNYFVASSD